MNIVSLFLEQLNELYENEDANKANTENIIDTNCRLFVESCGGWMNMINLCLTNPNISESINLDKLLQFKIVIEKSINDNIMSNNNKNIRDHGKHNDDDSSTVTELSLQKMMSEKQYFEPVKTVSSLPSSTITKPLSVASKLSQASLSQTCPSSYNYNVNIATRIPSSDDKQLTINASNMYEFYKCQLNVNVNEQDCMYFMMFNNTRNNNEINNNNNRNEKVFYIYRILKHNYFRMIFIVLVSFFFLIAEIAHYRISIKWFYILASVAYTFLVIYCITRLLIMNTVIMKLILNSFDFWYKLFNLVSALVAYIVVRTQIDSDTSIVHSPWFPYFYCLSGLVAYEIIFFLDALLILQPKIRLIATTSISLFTFYYGLNWYFYEKDYLWNPFDKYNFEYTQISSKSLYISSCFNLTLFILKPLISDSSRYVRRKMDYYCCNNNVDHNHKNNNNNENDVTIVETNVSQRCYSVYKRPYTKWQPVEKS